MADEIMEAIQMLRFGYDGVKLGLDVTGASLREVKNLTILIVGLLNHEKTQGKTSLKKMLKNSGNLQVLQIKDSDVKEFEKLAKRYGILYSKMPDINKGDGMKEYIFPVEATPRVNALIEKLGAGRLEDISDYVKNGDGNFEKTLEYLRSKGLVPDTPISINAERMEELKEMSRNIRFSENINDLNKVDITISKELVSSESPEAFVTRVPGTYGANVRFLKIEKDDIITINGGKTLLTFLEKDKEYELLDKDKKPIAKIKGDELRENHYDKVNEKVREQADRQREKQKREKKAKDQRARSERQNQQNQKSKKNTQRKKTNNKPKTNNSQKTVNERTKTSHAKTR